MRQSIIFLFIMLTAFAFTPPASAEVPVCKGKSILEDERAKDPEKFDEAMKGAKDVPNSQAVFWRIEKPGTDKVSWLFGTVHITDPRVHNMPQAARTAIESAKIVALELKEIGDPQVAAQAMFKHLNLVALKPGENIWDMLGEKDSKTVTDELARRGLPSGMFAGMQPYVIAMMMAIPKCEMNRTKAGLRALDSELAKIAEKNNIKLVGLETIKEQLEAMSSMPLKAQKAFLLQTAGYGPRSADVFETMIELYLQRKMNVMYALMNFQGGNGVADHFSKILLTKRNKVMVKRAVPLIEKGSAFIAVGALHLVGKNGLVSLFENAGYKLVPVN